MNQRLQNRHGQSAPPARNTLDMAAPGTRCRIVRVSLKGPLRRRIMDMGLVAGAEIHVIRVAPLGDPMELKIKGYLLSVRKEDAQFIAVDILE